MTENANQGTSIGKYARELIQKFPTASNQEIKQKVRDQFPHARTSLACIAWYRSNMKKNKLLTLVPPPRTLELIEQEIAKARELVKSLENEYDDLKEEQRADLVAEFERLGKLLGKTEPEPTEQEDETAGDGSGIASDPADPTDSDTQSEE
jgi:hypothetical protein